jgi:hypothetical protein
MNEEKVKAWFKENFGDIDKTPSMWVILIAGAIFVWIGVIATWKGIKFIIQKCKGVKNGKDDRKEKWY